MGGRQLSHAPCLHKWRMCDFLVVAAPGVRGAPEKKAHAKVGGRSVTLSLVIRTSRRRRPSAARALNRPLKQSKMARPTCGRWIHTARETIAYTTSGGTACACRGGACTVHESCSFQATRRRRRGAGDRAQHCGEELPGLPLLELVEADLGQDPALLFLARLRPVHDLLEQLVVERLERLAILLLGALGQGGEQERFYTRSRRAVAILDLLLGACRRSWPWLPASTSNEARRAHEAQGSKGCARVTKKPARVLPHSLRCTWPPSPCTRSEGVLQGTTNVVPLRDGAPYIQKCTVSQRALVVSRYSAAA